jgi:hypothetical protein
MERVLLLVCAGKEGRVLEERKGKEWEREAYM